MVKSYRELVVWQRAMSLAEAVYSVSSSLPSDERFGLTAQLRRASVSVGSNIAEGYERRSRADYRRMLLIACGSVAEIETQLELCRRLGYSSREATAEADRLADEVGRMLRAIERSLRAPSVSEDAKDYIVPNSDGLAPSALSPQPSALDP